MAVELLDGVVCGRCECVAGRAAQAGAGRARAAPGGRGAGPGGGAGGGVAAVAGVAARARRRAADQRAGGRDPPGRQRGQRPRFVPLTAPLADTISLSSLLLFYFVSFFSVLYV